jgi:hypothetical protein
VQGLGFKGLEGLRALVAACACENPRFSEL